MALVMRYVQREAKTLWEEQRLVTGINCRPESVYDDFLRTKLLYHNQFVICHTTVVVKTLFCVVNKVSVKPFFISHITHNKHGKSVLL